jgi:hypothetical protein
MRFKQFKSASLMFLAAVLSACGGGGGSSNDSGFNPPGLRATATAQQTSIPAAASTDISVRITEVGGAPIRDGTTVSASVSPASVGTVVGVNAGGTTQGTTANTVGGNANFRFTGQTPGTAVVSFSAQDPSAPNRSVTASVTITVTPGPTRISMEATRTTIPINTYNIRPFFGSPYMSEVTITVRDSAGNPVSQPGGVHVSINPVGPAGFSTLNDPATPENEFEVIIAQGPVNVLAGKATVFVHSENQTGNPVLTATTQDPVTGQVFTAQLAFNIVATLPIGPEEIIVSYPSRPAYVQGSGANTTLQIEAIVLDGIGQPIPDPQAGNAGFNNLRAQLISTGADPGRLVAINASGQQVSGTDIALRTNSGVANLTYRAGAEAGQYVVRVTADRADNNVDNGIQDPVVGEATVTVSDGRLFSLSITSPRPNAILINRVDPTVEPAAPGTIPADPDGTYSYRVSVLATDREGNPVPEGTEIEFGLIDDPIVGYPQFGVGFFAIGGNDGDPEEAGFNFHAPTGLFNTAQYPSGPGDTLLVFGKSVPGNRDLESARRIASNVSINRVTVAQRFNRNDDSGQIQNNGPVLPYAIGRAVDGNIIGRARTNSIGVASVTLNYPVRKLGKALFVWARAQTTDRLGNPKLVTDIRAMAYPGIAPAVLTVSPTQIPGNSTSTLTLCLEDAATHPLPGVRVAFSFQGVSGSVDGQSGQGVTAAHTGANGCLNASATTFGVVPGQQGRIVFTAAGAPAEVEVLPPNQAVLQALPSAFRGDGTFRVTLRLLDPNGTPVNNVQLQGNCETDNAEASLAIISGPGSTGADGRTVVDVTASGFLIFGANATAVSGTCTFSAPGGQPEVTVRFGSINGCNLTSGPIVSPAPDPRCVTEGEDDPNNSTLTVALQAATGSNGSGAVTSSPSGITCSLAAGVGSNSCQSTFTTGTTVTLTATPAAGNTLIGWSGGCVATTGNPLQSTAALSSNQTCTAVFSDGGVATPNQAVLGMTLQAATGSSGAGSITSVPAGLSCSLAPGIATQTCSANFAPGATVTLNAVPSATSAVLGWSGTCVGSLIDPNQATITMNGNQDCRVIFGNSGGGSTDPVDLAVTLNAAAGTRGGGTVVSAPAGIACSLATGSTTTSCTAEFERNSAVTLTATPNLDSVFVGWTGSCLPVAGQPTQATVQMTADRACIATFGELGATRVDLALTLGALGGASGSVSSTPTGLACSIASGQQSASCTSTFVSGGNVILTANPGVNSELIGWTGACVASAGDPLVANVLMTSAQGCTATFGPVGGPLPEVVTLTIEMSPEFGVISEASGRAIVSSPVNAPPGTLAGCSLSPNTDVKPTCTADYLVGAQVQLVAAPAVGSAFVGWNGPCLPGDLSVPNVVQITMLQDDTCTAFFRTLQALVFNQLTINLVITADSGTIDGEVGRVVPITPGGIDQNPDVPCVVAATSPVSCVRNYPLNQVVVLQAISGPDGTFTGWAGGCQATQADPNLAVVQLDLAKTCQANFTRN